MGHVKNILASNTHLHNHFLQPFAGNCHFNDRFLTLLSKIAIFMAGFFNPQLEIIIFMVGFFNLLPKIAIFMVGFFNLFLFPCKFLPFQRVKIRICFWFASDLFLQSGTGKFVQIFCFMVVEQVWGSAGKILSQIFFL